MDEILHSKWDDYYSQIEWNVTDKKRRILQRKMRVIGQNKSNTTEENNADKKWDKLQTRIE